MLKRRSGPEALLAAVDRVTRNAGGPVQPEGLPPGTTRKPRVGEFWALPGTDGYSAHVMAVDEPHPNLGDERATRIHYVDEGGKAAGEISLLHDPEAGEWVLGNHSIYDEHRGRGLGRRFVPVLAKSIGRIASDPGASPDERKMWEYLAKNGGARRTGSNTFSIG